MPYWDRFKHRKEKRQRDDWVKYQWWLQNFFPSVGENPKISSVSEKIQEIRKNINDARSTLKWAVDKYGAGKVPRREVAPTPEPEVKPKKKKADKK